MYNTKFILEDGNEIYPGYLDKERRMELQITYGEKRGFMWCGCNTGKKLTYRISGDLKIYPEHNNYEHHINCCRYKNKEGKAVRQTGYVVDDETGEVTTYLTFNPKSLIQEKDEIEVELNLDTVEEDEEIEERVLEAESENKNEEVKEPKLSLPSLVRSINVDTYTEKVLNDVSISSREVFAKHVYFRMKKVRVSRMKKSIGDLTLEEDGVRFLYSPFVGALKSEDKGLARCYFVTKNVDGKEFKNFIFPETMEKALKEFEKKYGIEPDENTMLAAFQYYKQGRNKVRYKVLGRVHLFQVSDLGVYCRNMVEKEAYDAICEIAKDDKDIKLWIPADDESIGGIIKISGKAKRLLLLFRTKKTERITYNIDMYQPFVVSRKEPVTVPRFYQSLEDLDI